jgi:ribosome-binding protein aMBF1 (putative translation factor)
VEISPGGRDLVRQLKSKDKAMADRAFDRLAERGPGLRMPHARPLGGGLCEPRFTCEGTARRVTYYIDVQRRIITLTTFRKQRQNERQEVARAGRLCGPASKQEAEMADITLDELRAKYPPEDRNEYDRAYAAATLAGQLAELVYTLRTRAGLTQTELARRMGTTQSSIARIEGGGSLPTLDVLARLAHATGTPLRLAAPGITDVDLGGAA